MKDKIGYVLVNTIIVLYMTTVLVLRLTEGLSTPTSHIFQMIFMLTVMIVSWLAYYRIVISKNKPWLRFYIIPFLVNFWVGYHFTKGITAVDSDDYSILLMLTPLLLILAAPIILYIVAYFLIRDYNKTESDV
ncbi:hypothetical protein [Lentibacillus sp. CBA3610]|uniref:hypothetical protein n=1 Tax=Lentibacillus sp. CBA3610 TaxID=2518176 RepID=UPI0015959C7A|nr:hypothetical protein [Lentibacillus sp. CBA3610]QKY70145.1 hypothetical protein Len3610_11590 [Lentibacillus sp. CBA3610]